MLQLFKRALVVLLFQVFDYPVSDCAFHIARKARRLVGLIGQQMHMVGHNDVSEEQEAMRLPRLIDCITGNGLDRVGLEDRQTILGHHCDVRRGSIP